MGQKLPSTTFSETPSSVEWIPLQNTVLGNLDTQVSYFINLVFFVVVAYFETVSHITDWPQSPYVARITLNF